MLIPGNLTMHKIIFFALLSVIVTAPALADETSAKGSTKKTAPAIPSVHKHAHKKATKADECDTVHGSGGHHQKGMDECDTVHGKGDHHSMGLDDCDTVHGNGNHPGHGMGEGMSEDMMEPDLHMLGALAITDQQQVQINKLADDLRHKNWTTQGLINDESAKLRDLYEADKRDPAAIGKEYQNIFDLKRQMIETYLDTQNRMEEVLTPEQREKMKHSSQKMHHAFSHSM
jgi:Spy/CpxP family protein refolding chaperone